MKSLFLHLLYHHTLDPKVTDTLAVHYDRYMGTFPCLNDYRVMVSNPETMEAAWPNSGKHKLGVK
jgi:hypothetical protein